MMIIIAMMNLLSGNIYQKRKTQEVSIKEGLLPIAWHPSRYWDWCVSEDEKQKIKKLWV